MVAREPPPPNVSDQGQFGRPQGDTRSISPICRTRDTLFLQDREALVESWVAQVRLVMQPSIPSGILTPLADDLGWSYDQAP